MSQTTPYLVRSVSQQGKTHHSNHSTREQADSVLQGVQDALALRRLPGQSLGVTLTLEHGVKVLERLSA